MKFNDRTRRVLAQRRMHRDLVIHKGWEVVGEGGGRLWELYRGGRCGHRIVDVRIAPCGTELFVKIEAAGPPVA